MSKRNLGKNIIRILLMIMLCLFLGGCSEEDAKPASTSGKSGLSVHYVDVGQGDCTLIECDGHYMLIDAGNNNKGTAVKSYLESQKVKKLDLVIGTHGDADHIGGLDVAIYNFDCSTIIMPDRKRDTKTYRDVIDTIEHKNYKLTYPKVGKTYSLGSAKVQIVAPCNYEYGNNENNYSVGVLVTYGESTFLFAGDAEEEAEEDILKNGIDIDCDVFKASHHGSRTANSEPFLDAALPEYVVISCGEGNDYGHPHAELLNELRSRGIKVFRTDEQGTVVATTDGKKITFNMSPSESWLSGEQVKSDKELSDEKNTEEEIEIIGNKTSKKYHTKDCGSLPMEENRVYFDSEKEAKKAGYEKCGKCEG